MKTFAQHLTNTWVRLCSILQKQHIIQQYSRKKKCIGEFCFSSQLNFSYSFFFLYIYFFYHSTLQSSVKYFIIFPFSLSFPYILAARTIGGLFSSSNVMSTILDVGPLLFAQRCSPEKSGWSGFSFQVMLLGFVGSQNIEFKPRLPSGALFIP